MDYPKARTVLEALRAKIEGWSFRRTRKGGYVRGPGWRTREPAIDLGARAQRGIGGRCAARRRRIVTGSAARSPVPKIEKAKISGEQFNSVLRVSVELYIT